MARPGRHLEGAETRERLLRAAAKLIAFRGTMNLVGTEPLDGEPDIDFGRLHYHYTAYVGTNSLALDDSYGEARNRADFRPNGVAAFVGAAGAMGQMHIQRAFEMADGPETLVCIDPDQARMAVLVDTLKPLADSRGKVMVVVDPMADDPRAIIDGYLSIKDPLMDVIYEGARHWAASTNWEPDGSGR